MIPNTYSEEEKDKIASEIKNISEEDALNDFRKLRKIGKSAHDKGLSPIGNKVVDRYSFKERLEVVGKKNMRFFDVYFNRHNFNRPSIDRYLERYGDTIKSWYAICRMYFSSVAIFRPIVAMEVYARYEPHTVLDFTMGWGGRMVGACALDVPKYIGIDSNTKLEGPYDGMCALMRENTKTEMELYFQDCLTMDYSKLEYDMVLTSPPYYNYEIYRGQKSKSMNEWDTEFYEPIIKRTYDGLKAGGHYCLNVSPKVYDRVVYKILGEPLERIELKNKKRTSESVYTEYIYIWRKP
jgi:hypothetical protein